MSSTVASTVESPDTNDMQLECVIIFENVQTFPIEFGICWINLNTDTIQVNGRELVFIIPCHQNNKLVFIFLS